MQVKTESKRSRAQYRAPLLLIGKTRSNDVWHRMREDILSGVLSPGARLPFGHLRSIYGVAFATLREALSRLATEQLVVADAQKGFSVAPIDIDELLDITRVRVMLETEALRDSILKGHDDWRASVMRSYHTLDRLSMMGSGSSPDWFDAHRKYHATLIAACGSPTLVSICGRLFDSCLRYRRIAIARLPPSDEPGQHRTLMEAALTGRVDDAVETNRKQIWKITKQVVAAIEQANGPQ